MYAFVQQRLKTGFCHVNSVCRSLDSFPELIDTLAGISIQYLHVMFVFALLSDIEVAFDWTAYIKMAAGTCQW
jgi:hypothetical protein